jgi:carboxyl-terminal processing protease
MATVAALALVFALGRAEFTPAASAEQAEQTKDQVQQQPAKDDAALKRLSEVQEKLAKHYVTPVDEKVLAEHALKGLLEGLKDPYTVYLTPEEMLNLEKMTKGSLTGIGVQLAVEQNRITVVSPIDGSPALKAGLAPGDVIDAIDGKTTSGLTLAQVVQRILGPAGEVVKLKVVHPDGVVKEIPVTRAEIRLSNISGFRRDAEGKWQYVLDGDHKIGYLHIGQFASNTAAEVRDVITGLQKTGLKGLILDLRSCPGGLLEQSVEVGKLLLPKGVIVTIRGPGKEEKVFEADGKNNLGDFPIVVLVNEQTASAAEILAGALSDNNRAILLGTRTFGKGSVQAIMKLDQGGALRVTTGNHYLPSGRNIQKRPGEKNWGVDPNDGYYIPLTPSQAEALRKDEQKRGLLGLKADELDAKAGRLTAKVIEEKHADPQLAAALRTMVARLTGGEFIKVGKSHDALLDQAGRLEHLRQRREELQQNMNQLDRDIADLQKSDAKQKN